MFRFNNKIDSIEIICFLNKNWTKHQGACYNRNFLRFFLTQVTQLLKENFTSTNYLNITPPFTHYSDQENRILITITTFLVFF